MSNPQNPQLPGAERDKEEVRTDLADVLTAHLTEQPQDVDVLLEHGTDEVTSQLVDRRERKRGTGRGTRRKVDWSTPPYVDEGDAEDFRQMLSKKYEGMNEEQARAKFIEYGLDFDTCTAADLAKEIRALRSDVDRSDDLGSACFVFCDVKIPAAYRDDWAIAIMAARDHHEGD